MAKKNSSKENKVELEFGNDKVIIESPFNPNDITINIVPRTIGQIIDMLEFGEILIPKFQRRPNLWDQKKKSRFIESLMLNLPIPLFYFDEGLDKKWRVIDGLQRISTLEHFILADKLNGKTISGNKESLRLENLEWRKEFDGKCWDDLPRDVQRRIQTNQITINLIGKGTPDEVKYNIYSRINQGGIELKPQEIRTALFQGHKMDFIESLVSAKTEQGKLFLKATDNSVPTKRQEDLDFATRFISFFLYKYSDYEPDMDTFMTKGTGSIPSDDKIIDNLLTSFKNAMELSIKIFDIDAFRKPRSIENKRMPINKPLFEVISVNFAKLSKDNTNRLLKNKTDFLLGFGDLLQDENFWSSITSGTAKKEGVRTRHTKFENLINKII